MKIDLGLIKNRTWSFWKTISKSGGFWLLLPVLFILVLSIRGLPGSPNAVELDQDKWVENGPFELSPERGRFALVYSVVEDGSLSYSLPVARFALPDLAYQDGKFVSRFAPTVSFLAIPGYLLGKTIGLSQVGTYFIIALFAALNTLLIRAIAIKLGANSKAATVGSLVFLFASPSFAYAVNLYQHHISTFTILLAIYILMRSEDLLSAAMILFLCGLSVTVDYPNLFLMFPVGLAALVRIVSVKSGRDVLKINFKLTGLLCLMAVVLPMLFLFWFNKVSFGDPFQLSGTVPGVKDFDEQGKPLAPRDVNPEDLEFYLHPELQEKTAVGFFLTRNLMNGLYLHLLSPDRGMLMFTPVMFLGMFGLWILYKKRDMRLNLFLSILGVNLLLYSMWGDPWGGWAFGSRYLIPAYALLAVLISVALSKYKKGFLFIPLFLFLFSYSAYVNTAGALSTSANPPKVEVLELEKLSGKVQKYTFARNTDYLKSHTSKSFIYQTVAGKYLSAWNYFKLVYALIMTATMIPLLGLLLPEWKLLSKVKSLLKRV